MPIIWNESYNTGIKQIDEQHKVIIKLINQLLESIEDGIEKNDLGEIFSELIKYSDYHFKTEEDYFKKISYPETERHLQSHQDFRAQLMNLSQDYSENTLKVSNDLLDFLENWFIDHINGTDKRYVGAFLEGGIK